MAQCQLKRYMSYKWIKIQTHVHTLNSDGSNTLDDMALHAKASGIDAILLTDHNTFAGFQNADKISEKYNINIIKAIEYTTFYGHIIVINSPYYRWENLNDTSLNELADYVHNYGGIIGIAHPMGVGDPTCTGGNFSYKNVDFNKIDFIEVWHGVTDKFNEAEKNRLFWLDKLSQVKPITALYGGDFHKKEHFIQSNSFNWLQIDEQLPIELAIKQAIKAGRIIMSKGPFFNIKIEHMGESFIIGDTIPLVETNSVLNIDFGFNSHLIDENISIKLTDNKGKIIITQNVNLEEISIAVAIKNDIKWIIPEIINNLDKSSLAVGNPIYFNCQNIIRRK